MKITNCKQCGIRIERRGNRPGIFCGIICKAESQRQSIASKEWLYQKYIIEGLGTYEIANLVNRDPKRVYEWLKQDGIQLRTQHDAVVEFNKRETTREKRSLKRKGVALTTEQRDKISKSRTGKHYPKLQGAGNGMFGRTGTNSPAWKGGLTPERQALYSSLEWTKVVKDVWKRDAATCQKCGCLKQKDITFEIHHIVSFAVKELRAELSNLVLLCRKCHKFVHSRKNVDKEFIG